MTRLDWRAGPISPLRSYRPPSRPLQVQPPHRLPFQTLRHGRKPRSASADRDQPEWSNPPTREWTPSRRGSPKPARLRDPPRMQTQRIEAPASGPAKDPRCPKRLRALAPSPHPSRSGPKALIHPPRWSTPFTRNGRGLTRRTVKRHAKNDGPGVPAEPIETSTLRMRCPGFSTRQRNR